VAKKITTLYIDDTSLRLMVTRGKRISKLADAPLDMSFADTSAKVREAELVTKIKQLFKTNKVKAKNVIVGLSGLHCLSRPVVLPQLPRAMLDEAVIREAQRVLPVPPEQLYITWQIISVTEGKMQAFMEAIPRQTADTLLSVLHQVGLKPYLMDIKPLALARLVQEATAILVDVQSREFDIVIMADGIPQPIRTVSFPQEALSLPEKLLIVKDELKRTVQFYNSNNPENPIQPSVNMYVSGEADEPELYESLANELGYRVLSLSSPLKCPKQLDPAHHLVNIGLTLKELPKEAGPLLANLNTLPMPYQPKPVSLGKIVALPATLAAIGLIILVAMTVQDAAASINSVSSQLDAANLVIEQRQNKKKELIDNIEALEKELAAMQANRNVFTNALDSLDKWGDAINGDLEATVYNLVRGINLSGFNHSGQELNIHGQAPSEVEVLQYARNLDASGRFSEVTIASIRRVEGDSGGEEIEIIGASEEIEGEGEEIEVLGEEIEGGGDGNGVMDFTLSLKLKGW
jgi:type IV pilus assembly protein PilM